MAPRRRLFVGLVLSGEAATEIDGVRRGLGSPDLHRLAPHITLVPPFNLPEERFEELSGTLSAICASHRALVVSLGPPSSFAGRGVVYLEVGGDLEELGALRGELYAAIGSPGDKDRSFVPHVTVGTRLEPLRIEAAALALSSYARRVELCEVSLLERAMTGPERRWTVIGGYRLAAPFVHGRGGRELELSASRSGDPLERAFLESAWADYRLERYGPFVRRDEPFFVAARLGEEIIGAAAGTFTATTCRLERLVVARPHRGEGIGSALLSYVERLARERACEGVQLFSALDGPACGFYRSHGYVQQGELPNWRAGFTFGLFGRAL